MILLYNSFITILKLCRKYRESTQEWIGRLQTKIAECLYRGSDSLLKEKFIGGLSDDDMTDKILREVTRT